jgi:superfamily II DNA or RNA helicase
MARSRFDWAAVEPGLIRQLLRTAYLTQTHPDSESADATRVLDEKRLAAAATRVLGSPPRPDLFDRRRCGDNFLDWLCRQPAATVRHAAQTLADARRDTASLSSKRAAVAYLRSLRMSSSVRKAIRSAFVSSPDHRSISDSGGSSVKSSLVTPFTVETSGGPQFDPWLHQKEAWEQLGNQIDVDRVSPQPPRGLLVLPTGAGKTSTLTEWLAPNALGRDEPIRVLWLAHQVELLQQAQRSMAAAIGRLPHGTKLKGRLIGGGGDPVSTLSDPELSMAFVSIQSLVRNYSKQKRSHLANFTSRPTIVVVDEAHHAGADGYDRILDDLCAEGLTACVGLTATPHPTGVLSRSVFRENFPETFYEAEALTLMERDILARPTIQEVDTGLSIILDGDERRQYEALRDLPPAVLRRLDRDERNQFLVDLYASQRKSFGPTLVFASSREHADRLGEMFEEVAPTRVLHGGLGIDRTEVLEWFRKRKGPRALVSVGMLTEGVDLPSAKTALLARPTTSRILLKQMVGRVLRGPRAGGEPTAHVVYLRDDWDGAPDILSPYDVIEGTVGPPSGRSTGTGQLPPLRDDDGHDLPPAVERELRRFQNHRTHTTATTALVGYYVLDEILVPVLSHQRESFEELLDFARHDLRGYPAISAFDDCPDPVPTRLTIKSIIDFVRAHECDPEFVPVQATCSPNSVALLLREGARSEAERDELMRDRYENSLARSVFQSLDDFRDAVEDELRRLRRGGLNDTMPEQLKGGERPLPRADRDLEQLRDRVIAWMVDHLPHLRERLTPVPEIDWTSRVNESLLGSWVPVRSGRNRGAGRIRINRLFRTPRKHVSDEMLEYLIYHEVLHHVLPLRGHDSLFRSLESKWPGAARLDTEFDTLRERWDLRRSAYERRRH